MDVIHNVYTEQVGFDFYGSPTVGVNSIDTKFIPVVLAGGDIQNTYTGAMEIQDGYYTN